MPEEHAAHTGPNSSSAAAVPARTGGVGLGSQSIGMPAAERGFPAAGVSLPDPLRDGSPARPAGRLTVTVEPVPAVVPGPSGHSKVSPSSAVLNPSALTNGVLQNGAGASAADSPAEASAQAHGADSPAAAPVRQMDAQSPLVAVRAGSWDAMPGVEIASQQQMSSQAPLQPIAIPTVKPQSLPSLTQQQPQHFQTQQKIPNGGKSGLAQQRHSIIAAAAAAQREADALLTGISPQPVTSNTLDGVLDSVLVSISVPASDPALPPVKAESADVEPAQLASPVRPAKRQAESAADAERGAQRKQKRRRRHERAWEQAQYLDLLQRMAAITAEAQEIDSETARLQALWAAPQPAEVPLTPQQHANLYANHIKRMADAVAKPTSAMMKSLMAHKWAYPFLEPVDTAKYDNYSEFVKRPMDLGTVKHNLDAGHYPDPGSLLLDLRQIFGNAVTFNPDPETNVHRMALHLLGLVEKWAGQIASKLQDAEAAWRNEEAVQRRTTAQAAAISRHEALVSRAEALGTVMDAFDQRLAEAQSLAASYCRPLTLTEKDDLAKAVGGLGEGGMTTVIDILERHHPDQYSSGPGDKCISMDTLNALTMRQLQHVVHTCNRAPAARAHAAADAHRRLAAAAVYAPPDKPSRKPADWEDAEPVSSLQRVSSKAVIRLQPHCSSAAPPSASKADAAKGAAEQRQPQADMAATAASAPAGHTASPASAPQSADKRPQARHTQPGPHPTGQKAVEQMATGRPSSPEVPADEAAVLAALGAPLHWPCLSVGGGAPAFRLPPMTAMQRAPSPAQLSVQGKSQQLTPQQRAPSQVQLPQLRLPQQPVPSPRAQLVHTPLHSPRAQHQLQQQQHLLQQPSPVLQQPSPRLPPPQQQKLLLQQSPRAQAGLQQWLSQQQQLEQQQQQLLLQRRQGKGMVPSQPMLKQAARRRQEGAPVRQSPQTVSFTLPVAAPGTTGTAATATVRASATTPVAEESAPQASPPPAAGLGPDAAAAANAAVSSEQLLLKLRQSQHASSLRQEQQQQQASNEVSLEPASAVEPTGDPGTKGPLLKDAVKPAPAHAPQPEPVSVSEQQQQQPQQVPLPESHSRQPRKPAQPSVHAATPSLVIQPAAVIPAAQVSSASTALQSPPAGEVASGHATAGQGEGDTSSRAVQEAPDVALVTQVHHATAAALMQTPPATFTAPLLRTALVANTEPAQVAASGVGAAKQEDAGPFPPAAPQVAIPAPAEPSGPALRAPGLTAPSAAIDAARGVAIGNPAAHPVEAQPIPSSSAQAVATARTAALMVASLDPAAHPPGAGTRSAGSPPGLLGTVPAVLQKAYSFMERKLGSSDGRGPTSQRPGPVGAAKRSAGVKSSPQQSKHPKSQMPPAKRALPSADTAASGRKAMESPARKATPQRSPKKSPKPCPEAAATSKKMAAKEVMPPKRRSISTEDGAPRRNVEESPASGDVEAGGSGTGSRKKRRSVRQGSPYI